MKNSRLLICILMLVYSLHAGAASLSLAEVLEAFKKHGFNFVYSSNVVDVSRVVDWSSSIFTIVELNDALQSIGLTVEKLDNSTWGIVLFLGIDTKTSTRVQPAIDDIENIIVTASLHEVYGRQSTSYIAIDKSQLEQTPSFGGDAIRIVHRLPGAATLGVSSRPNIRGGYENELLVVFDGVELINPFHLRDFQSMFSAVNPRTIQNIDYFTGGFPAQYGNRMSGVMDISIQDNFEASGGELGISTFTTSALLFGESGDSHWMFSARRGNLDLFLKRVNPSLGDPDYYDLYGKFSQSFGENELSVSAIVFDDDIRFTTTEEIALSEVKNRTLWAQFKLFLSDSWYSESQISLGSVEASRKGETLLEERSEGTIIDLQDLDIISIKQLVDWRVNDALKLSAGLTFTQTDIRYDTVIDVDKGIVADVLNLPDSVSIDFQQNFKESNSNVYAAFRYKLSKKIMLQAGVRYDRQSYGPTGSDAQLSPRISMLFTVADDLLLRFSFGRFYQPQSLYELETSDGESAFFKAQKSDHWILSAEYQISSFSKFEAEIFYKSMEDLKPRYQNLFNPYVLLPEMEPDRFTINAARAYAKGIELSYSATYDLFEWAVNYSYSKVQDLEDGRWIDRRWDQPHSVNGRLNWHPGNFDVGITAAWHSGWSFTRLPESLRLEPDRQISSIRSNERLGDFFTLDCRVAYEFQLANSTLMAFAEVTNILNNTNEGGIEYEIGEEDDELVLEEVDLEPVFPLVGSVGVVWRF